MTTSTVQGFICQEIWQPMSQTKLAAVSLHAPVKIHGEAPAAVEWSSAYVSPGANVVWMKLEYG